MRGLLATMLCWGALAVQAQPDAVRARHQRIGELYEAQRFPELIHEVEVQLREVARTTYADSLHRYLYKYARAHRKVKDPAASTAAGERILALVKTRGVADHELEALFDLSWVYYEAGEMKQCARFVSLAVQVADGDPSIPFTQRGRARQYLVFDHSVLGDHRRAGQWARDALAQYEKADSVPVAQWAESYTAVGVPAWHLGRVREAEAYYMKALDKLGAGTSEAVLNRKATAYGNLAVLWQSAGDMARAQQHYQENLLIYERLLASTDDQFTRDEMLVNRSRTYVNLATVKHNCAHISVSFLNSQSQRVRKEVSEPITGSNDEWKVIEIGPLIPDVKEEKQFIVIGCHVLTGERLDVPGSTTPQVRFDDIWIGEAPRLSLKTIPALGKSTNRLYLLGEEIVIQTEIQGVDHQHQHRLIVDLFDDHGKQIASRPSDVEPLPDNQPRPPVRWSLKGSSDRSSPNSSDSNAETEK